MELLVAVLIAFGVVSSGDAQKMSKSEIEKVASDSGISQKEIESKIIGLEESDM